MCTRKPTPLTMRMLLSQLLLQMLMVMLMTSDDVSGHTVCTAVAVISDPNAIDTNVTCHFGKSVSEYNFNVQFFPAPGSDSEVVLYCNRIDGKLVCNKGRGVVFDDNQQLSNELTLTKSSSDMPTHQAQYFCQVVPKDEWPSQPCNVMIIHIPSRPSQAPAMRPEEQNNISALDVVSFLLLMVIVVIVVIVVGYKRKDRIRKWCLGPIEDCQPGVQGDLKNPPKPEEPTEETMTTPMLTNEEEEQPKWFAYKEGLEAAKTRGKKEKKEER